MLTAYQAVAASAVLVLAMLLGWLAIRSRRRMVRYVPVGLLGRRYIVWFPIPRKRQDPVPIVFAFHAEGGTVEQLERQTALHMARAAARFAIVYPEGYHRSWNAGSCCGDAVTSRIDEVKFVHAIMADLASLMSVDRRRIYATGYSNGAMLCYLLACKISDEIAAIAPVDGGMAVADCAPKQPVPLFHVDGLAGERGQPDGSGAVTAAGGQVPTADAIAFWRGFSGLADTTHVQMFGGCADCTIYSGDRSDAEVRVCAIRKSLRHRPDRTKSDRRGDLDGGGPFTPVAVQAELNDAILGFFLGKSLPERPPQRIRIDLD